MHKPLWSHQETAIKECENRDAYALFFSMRCGKSATAIHILKQKCEKEKRLLKTLIITPLITLENWVNEFKLHSDIKEITILSVSQKDRIKLFEQNSKDGHVFITNHETMAVMKDLVELFHKWNPDFLILDESQKYKEISSKRTKELIKLADKIKYKLILSGTPILNSPMDIFAQYRILLGGFPEEWGLEKNFFSWRARYFYDKNARMPSHVHFPDFQIRPESYKTLNEKIYKHAMRVKLEDCHDLPEETEEIFEVDLSPEQQKHYDEMKEDFLTYVGSEACVASLAITKMLRLQQIVSGFIKLENDEIIRFKNTPRQIALRDFLESATKESKCTVWCIYKENYQQVRDICKELGLSYVEATGEISTDDKFENMRRFALDPEIKIFMGHPKAAGIGIDLTASTYNFFYSRDHNLGDFLQAKARPVGPKQKKMVRHIHLSAKGTIDQLITKALVEKMEMSEKMLIYKIKEQMEKQS